MTVGASTNYGHWRLHASARRDLETNQMVSTAIGGAYENECAIFDVEFTRRYTSLDGDNGATSLIFQITLKTVGTFGFNSL